MILEWVLQGGGNESQSPFILVEKEERELLAVTNFL